MHSCGLVVGTQMLGLLAGALLSCGIVLKYVCRCLKTLLLQEEFVFKVLTLD
jgi:hypothetical protein